MHNTHQAGRCVGGWARTGKRARWVRPQPLKIGLRTRTRDRSRGSSTFSRRRFQPLTPCRTSSSSLLSSF